MIHDKEIELKILEKITQTGKVYEDVFMKMFDNWLEYAVIFRRLVSQSYILERSDHIEGKDHVWYQLSEYGEQKRKSLEREKADELKKKKRKDKLNIVAVIAIVAALLAAWPVIKDAFRRIISLVREL